MWAMEQYTWIIPSSFVFHHHMYPQCISRRQQRSICFFFLALLLQDMPTTQIHMQLPVELTCRFAIPRKIGLDFHSTRRIRIIATREAPPQKERQKVNCSSMLSPQVLCFMYLRPSRHEIMSRKHLVLSEVAQRPGSLPPAEELSVHKTARVRPPGAESVTIALASTQGQVWMGPIAECNPGPR